MKRLAPAVERAGSFLRDIKGIKGNILISAHAAAMKGIPEYLIRTARDPADFNPPAEN